MNKDTEMKINEIVIPGLGWNGYLKQLYTFLSEKNGYVKHKETCDHMVKCIIEQLYKDRYISFENDDGISNITAYLPREGSGIDKRTNVVKMISHRYYYYYSTYKQECEWDDLAYDLCEKNKNNPLQLYRKDVSYCNSVYQKELKRVDQTCDEIYPLNLL
jgi:hypothetical protein